MKRLFAGVGICIAVLIVTGCSASTSTDQSAEQLDDLRSAIESGAECTELFSVFDQIDEDAEDFPTAQGEMANVGCYSRDSARSDSELEAQAPDSPWLGVPGEVVTPSAQCSDAAGAAAGETDSTRAEPLIAATLAACQSVDEWMSVLALQPGVMGMADGYIPQLLDLQSVCYSYIETVVCQDALARGIAVGP